MTILTEFLGRMITIAMPWLYLAFWVVVGWAVLKLSIWIIRKKPLWLLVAVIGLGLASCRKDAAVKETEIKTVAKMKPPVFSKDLKVGNVTGGLIFASEADATTYFKANAVDHVFHGVLKPDLPASIAPDPITQIVTLSECVLVAGHNVTFTWTNVAASQGAMPAGGTLAHAFGGGIYALSNISSHMTGVSLGWNWTQTGAVYTNYPNSYQITYTVMGTQNFLYSSNGTSGSLMGMDVMISGTYNVKTYEYTMQVHYFNMPHGRLG